MWMDGYTLRDSAQKGAMCSVNIMPSSLQVSTPRFYLVSSWRDTLHVYLCTSSNIIRRGDLDWQLQGGN